MSFYRNDLAHIHDDGFGRLASAGAAIVLNTLDRNRLDRGTIVDVGCGSGLTARDLTDSGYSVVGIDVSESLVKIARN